MTLPRYQVTYTIGSRSYWFTIPAPNAAHIWRSWDRPGSKLETVEEITTNPNPRLTYQDSALSSSMTGQSVGNRFASPRPS